MRDVVFKNMTSTHSRKKDVILKEAFEKDGVFARVERRCFYYVRDVLCLANADGLQKWMDSKKEDALSTSRHFNIMREHSDRLGEDKVICKIAGTFYAVVDSSVYTIAFMHYFKVYFAKMPLVK